MIQMEIRRCDPPICSGRCGTTDGVRGRAYPRRSEEVAAVLLVSDHRWRCAEAVLVRLSWTLSGGRRPEVTE